MSNLEHFPFLFPSEWPASDRQDSQKSETFDPPDIEATQLPSNTSLHDFFPDEILARIFSFMVWSWAWSGVCRKWHQIIRGNDWAKLAIPASKRDFRLYPHVQGLLYMVRHLEFTQCRCHPSEILLPPWNRSNMRSLVIKGFEDTTSFSLAAQFSELITLELRGALDYRHPDVPVTELREQAATVPTYPNTFPPTLQHLHLHYLSVKTLTRIQLWAAEQKSPFASLTHLQLSLAISEEIQSLLLVLHMLSTSLVSLALFVSDPHPTGIDTPEQLTPLYPHPFAIHFTQILHIRLQVSKYVLCSLLPLLKWISLDTLEIALRFEAAWTYPEFVEGEVNEYGNLILGNHYCRLGSPVFARRFPFAQLEALSTWQLSIYCPCRDPHPESVHQRFQACATIVDFHNPFCHPYDGNSSTTEPSDEASDARSDESSDAGSAEASPAEGSDKGSDSTAASNHANQSSPATEPDEVALPSAPPTQPLGWDLAPEIVSGWDLDTHEVVEANLGWAAAGTNLSGGNPPEPPSSWASRLEHQTLESTLHIAWRKIFPIGGIWIGNQISAPRSIIMQRPYRHTVFSRSTYTWNQGHMAPDHMALFTGQRMKQSRAWKLEYHCHYIHHRCADLDQHQRQHPHECSKYWYSQTTLQDYFTGPWSPEFSEPLSINDKLCNELLLKIFSHLQFAWAWAETCPLWYKLIRRLGWKSLAIPSSSRDDNLYGFIKTPWNPESPPLRFVCDLNWVQCHCHQDEILHLPGLGQLQKLHFCGFDIDTPLSILTHFPCLTSLILTGWEDDAEPKNESLEFEIRAHTNFLSSSLTSLSLWRLDHTTLDAICSWTASHQLSECSPPSFSTTLANLHLSVIDSQRHYFELQDSIPLTQLEKLQISAGECILRTILYHLEIPAFVSINIPQSSGRGHHPPDHALCRLEAAQFHWTFPFDLFETAAPKAEHFEIWCPCAKFDGHSAAFVLRFLDRGKQVIVDSVPDADDASDDSDTSKKPDSGSQNPQNLEAPASRWTRHEEWDGELQERNETHVCSLSSDPHLMTALKSRNL
ncbi:hypothetical protein C8J56DRAFT_884104 [Mycena floridula]|nr:hypothetical protein C8J56DRAFT_884104 [Mycena floridula]